MPEEFSIPQDPLIKARSHVYPGSVPNVGNMGPVPEALTWPKELTIEPVESFNSGKTTTMTMDRKTYVTEENSGGNVNYYLVEIKHPKRLDPYTAECEDIIEALEMNFAEGTAFKALWRRCAQKALDVQKAGDTPKRNAEKIIYYGQRMLAQDELEEKARNDCP